MDAQKFNILLDELKRLISEIDLFFSEINVLSEFMRELFKESNLSSTLNRSFKAYKHLRNKLLKLGLKIKNFEKLIQKETQKDQNSEKEAISKEFYKTLNSLNVVLNYLSKLNVQNYLNQLNQIAQIDSKSISKLDSMIKASISQYNQLRKNHKFIIGEIKKIHSRYDSILNYFESTYKILEKKKVVDNIRKQNLLNYFNTFKQQLNALKEHEKTDTINLILKKSKITTWKELFDFKIILNEYNAIIANVSKIDGMIYPILSQFGQINYHDPNFNKLGERVENQLKDASRFNAEFQKKVKKQQELINQLMQSFSLLFSSQHLQMIIFDFDHLNIKEILKKEKIVEEMLLEIYHRLNFIVKRKKDLEIIYKNRIFNFSQKLNEINTKAKQLLDKFNVIINEANIQPYQEKQNQVMAIKKSPIVATKNAQLQKVSNNSQIVLNAKLEIKKLLDQILQNFNSLEQIEVKTYTEVTHEDNLFELIRSTIIEKLNNPDEVLNLDIDDLERVIFSRLNKDAAA